MANSVDPDQTPPSAATDQDLHCLLQYFGGYVKRHVHAQFDFLLSSVRWNGNRKKFKTKGHSV